MTITLDREVATALPREEFPTLANWTYLDVARKAPLPRCAERAMQSFMRNVFDEAGKGAFSPEWVEDTRNELAEFLDVPARTLAFVKNTSEGLNLAVQSLPFTEGDNIVTGEFEHEAQIFALRRLSELRGVEIRIARGEDGRITPEALLRLVDDRTRLCAISHVAFSNGFRFDLPSLAAACRPRGIPVMTDLIQSVGILDLSLPALGADIVVAGCHKGLLGLNGTAFLYVREEWIGRMRPQFAAKSSVISGRLGDGPLTFRSDARCFEYGNPNFLGIHVLGASLRLLRAAGRADIERHVRRLSTRLIEKAQGAGIQVRTPTDWNERAGIVSFALAQDTDATVRHLAQSHIIANSKDGYVRASLHGYSSEDDIDRLVEALAGI